MESHFGGRGYYFSLLLQSFNGRIFTFRHGKLQRFFMGNPGYIYGIQFLHCHHFLAYRLPGNRVFEEKIVKESSCNVNNSLIIGLGETKNSAASYVAL